MPKASMQIGHVSVLSSLCGLSMWRCQWTLYIGCGCNGSCCFCSSRAACGCHGGAAVSEVRLAVVVVVALAVFVVVVAVASHVAEPHLAFDDAVVVLALVFAVSIVMVLVIGLPGGGVCVWDWCSSGWCSCCWCCSCHCRAALWKKLLK